ncbi:uncharacterized protein LOC110029389 [Phalaenopsis equestris]|uniref:uncharacterized protein LOC110029389 n=1 Tax=Phalaenopsis equestris TaxID=78828 RepID=UPI0009E36BEC|nr:uncharacterized protein LOC110029389 [Phalaenopsis equestris]
MRPKSRNSRWIASVGPLVSVSFDSWNKDCSIPAYMHHFALLISLVRTRRQLCSNRLPTTVARIPLSNLQAFLCLILQPPEALQQACNRHNPSSTVLLLLSSRQYSSASTPRLLFPTVASLLGDHSSATQLPLLQQTATSQENSRWHYGVSLA